MINRTDHSVFHRRADSMIDDSAGFFGCVTAVYRTSFSISIRDELVSVTCIKSHLHVMGFFIPDTSLFEKVSQGNSCEFKNGKFLIRGRNLAEGALINRPKHPAFSPSIYQGTLKRVLNYLKILGRKSPVSATYINSEKTTLSDDLNRFASDYSSGYLYLDDYIASFGCGSGLTPSWDDFCTGALLVDRWSNNPCMVIRNDFWSRLAQRTPIPSQMQIKMAVQGKSSLIFEETLAQILSGSASPSSLAECISIGHTSGTDILCGIHAALTCRLI